MAGDVGITLEVAVRSAGAASVAPAREAAGSLAVPSGCAAAAVDVERGNTREVLASIKVCDDEIIGLGATADSPVTGWREVWVHELYRDMSSLPSSSALFSCCVSWP